MDAKQEWSKLVKDLSQSAREFAGQSLQASARVLDRTAAALKAAKEKVEKQAERYAPPVEEPPSQEKL